MNTTLKTKYCSTAKLAAFAAAILLCAATVVAQPEDGPPPGGPDGPGGPEAREGGPDMREGERGRGFRDRFRDRARRWREQRPEGEHGEGRRGLGKYLEVVQSYQTAVQDPHHAVGLAALGIKEHYRRAGKPLEAAKEIDDILKTTTDQKMRNILLFVNRQIYEENKSTDKFMETSRQILRENLGK